VPEQMALGSGDPSWIGEYRLISRLGEGGQGVVYLAEAPSGARVVVKLLRTEGLRDAAARARLAREVSAARTVARFCTAQVIEARVDGEWPFIVSEYVEGPTLAEQVTGSGPLSGSPLDRLAIGTATALAAIHQARIVHRDFKPGNVVLGPDGARVIDFGIAHDLAGDVTATAPMLGTPAYTAPEQITSGAVGPPADMFAWASTMAFAATGHSPFAAGTPVAQMHQVVHGQPDLSGVPQPLGTVLYRCLAKDPALRPTAEQVLLQLLGGAREDASAVAFPGARVDQEPADAWPTAGAATATAASAGAPTAGAASGWAAAAPAAQAPPSQPLPLKPWSAAAGGVTAVLSVPPTGRAGGGVPGPHDNRLPFDDRAFDDRPFGDRPFSDRPFDDDRVFDDRGFDDGGFDDRRPFDDRMHQEPDPRQQWRPQVWQPSAPDRDWDRDEPPRRGRRLGPLSRLVTAVLLLVVLAAGIRWGGALRAIVTGQAGATTAATAPAKAVPAGAGHGGTAGTASMTGMGGPAASGMATGAMGGTPNVPAGFAGTWSGRIAQPPGSGNTFPVTLTLNVGASRGTLNLPTLGCAARLTVAGPVTADQQLPLTEQTTSDPRGKCAGSAQITLTPGGQGTMGFFWQDAANSGNTASATLTRN
jgi:Protein kinase domain